MAKTLQEIKDEVARENGQDDWHSWYRLIKYTPNISLIWNQVAERYASEKARESVIASLEKAAENATFHYVYDCSNPIITKSSITSEENIIIK